MRPVVATIVALLLAPRVTSGQTARILSPGARIDTLLARGAVHDYVADLGAGHSLALTVNQQAARRTSGR